MKLRLFFLGLTVATTALMAQAPDGTDINKAIPIIFGQTVSDIGDGKTAPGRIYSINVAKGQLITAILTVPNGQPSASMEMGLLPPTVKTLNGCFWGCNKPSIQGDYVNPGRTVTWNYQVAAAGTYYVEVGFASTGVNYNLQVTATGTPLAVPNPPTAGCLNGRVDYMTYSLQLIGVGLADEVSIGGLKACATCTVKQPQYTEVVSRLENAMRSKLNVEACYDSTGNIFQVKLIQP